MTETVAIPAGLHARLPARQRAMLAEMGVRLWWPEAPADGAQPAMALNAGAAGCLAEVSADTGSAALATDTLAPAEAALRKQTAQRAAHAEPASAAAGQALPAEAVANVADWRVLAGQYGPRILQAGELPRWLFVLDPAGNEAASATWPAQADGQRLLMNMAAAVRLRPQQVYSIHAAQHVPAPGHDAGGAAGAERRLAWLLPEIVRVQPHVLLCMGRHAAFSVLGSTASLGQLRGQAQRLPLPAAQGQADADARAALEKIPVLVTYAPAYLLRNPAAKRHAWQDLCLAHALVKAWAPPSAP